MELAASVKLLRNYFLATIFLITKVSKLPSLFIVTWFIVYQEIWSNSYFNTYINHGCNILYLLNFYNFVNATFWPNEFSLLVELQHQLVLDFSDSVILTALGQSSYLAPLFSLDFPYRNISYYFRGHQLCSGSDSLHTIQDGEFQHSWTKLCYFIIVTKQPVLMFVFLNAG